VNYARQYRCVWAPAPGSSTKVEIASSPTVINPGVRLRKGARPHTSNPESEKQTVSEGQARGARKR
jgi:hypothetical protein